MLRGKLPSARQLSSRQSSAEAARAQVDQALLNLSYCRIVRRWTGSWRSGCRGGRARDAGPAVMLVTQTGDLWVTANFGKRNCGGCAQGKGRGSTWTL